MSAPLDLATLLRGSWDLRRTIELHANGSRAEVSGIATWQPATDQPRRLRYEEVATLRMDGKELASTRTLLFDLGQPLHPHRAEVSFADGRPFYLLDLGGGRCEAIHLCGTDRYQGLVELLDDDRLIERWTVSGPAKDYISTSTLIRRS